jgi:predicted metalloprotease with PDZ domain
MKRSSVPGAPAVLLPVFLLLTLTFSAPAQTTIQISVDATDVPRRLIHAHLIIPATPGPMTLYYPQWLPGEHGPTGPIADLAGLRITALNRPVAWQRDPTNMFQFHLTVPPAATSLDVSLDFISPADAAGFSSGSSATSELAVLNWNQFLLYPASTPTDQLNYQATLKVPQGWRYGTALPIATESGNTIQFKPSSLTTLVDSPVSTGAHYRTIDLSPNGTPPHYLHIAADSDRALEITPEQVTHLKNLVQETGALFGARHYRDYHFLLTLSDHIAHFGLEHHESSDDRIGERSLVDEGPRHVTASLLPHEFTHSWNGKYRRPSGLATPDYEKPMKGDLLWVYEGLTQYLGEILTPRSGLLTPELYREHLALTAADLDNESGRQWRPLQDTATAAQILYGSRTDYSDFRRTVDFYPEGELIWLEADVTIRQLSQGKKSLDDFCRAFHGGSSGPPQLKPYTFDDVVATLNAVQPHDWAAFLRTRLDSTGPHAPLGGIVNSGWKLVYNDTAPVLLLDGEAEGKLASFWYSLGIKIKDDTTVIDVRVGSPAQKAGIAPAVKAIAVDNRQYSPVVLREALARAAKTPEPIDLLVRDGEIYKTFHIDYHQGEKYPHLERDESKPDLLTAIVKPHAPQ